MLTEPPAVAHWHRKLTHECRDVSDLMLAKIGRAESQELEEEGLLTNTRFITHQALKVGSVLSGYLALATQPLHILYPAG